MTGRILGFKAEIMKVGLDIRFVHYIIHRKHLIFQKMCCELNLIMNDIIKMIHFVKTCVLNSRLLKIFCGDMDSTHDTLLFYSDVCWLSRKVLKIVIELNDELHIFFFLNVKPNLSALLNNEKYTSDNKKQT